MTRPDRVRRADDELGAWTMWSRPVDPRLSAWGTPVRGYRQAAPVGGRHTTTASALLLLVIPFGARHRVIDADDHVTEVGAFVAGSHDVVGAVEAGDFTGVQVDLTPLAAARIVGGGLHELAGTTVAFDDVLGPAARHLVERLGNTRSWADRLDLLEAFLVDRWERGTPSDDTTTAVWRRLSSGTTTVDDLADDTGWSPRQLRRRVRAHLGLPPKRLARVVRFHRALRRLEHDRTTPLAAVAVQHGYSDQSHMTREFGRLAADTPAAVRSARAPRDEAEEATSDHD